MSGSPRERRRIQVVLPEATIEEIDGRVGRRQRGQFIQDAVEENLRQLRRAEAFERILASTEDVGIPEWGTRESASEWVDSLRQEWDVRVGRLRGDD
jgi:hypothetical protein